LRIEMTSDGKAPRTTDRPQGGEFGRVNPGMAGPSVGPVGIARPAPSCCELLVYPWRTLPDSRVLVDPSREKGGTVLSLREPEFPPEACRSAPCPW